MDRSLWLLMRLRAGALLRRWKRTFSKPKGIVMLVITSLIFVPWLFSLFAMNKVDFKPPVEQMVRIGPLALLALTSLSLFTPAGEQALYYSPAEVAFLFAGPFRKRQLLAYKLFTTLMLCLFSATFMALGTQIFAPKFLSAFVGSFALVLFLQLSQMAMGLASNTVGALAWSRGRRVVLLGLIGMAAWAAYSAGSGLAGIGFAEAIDRIERSTAGTIVLAPFRWFILAFTAPRIWPDLAKWSALALLVDLALVGVVFALEAGYLEAASIASEKRFAKMKRLTGGGGGIRSMGKRPTGRFRFRPPNPPWWGGVGPNFWRQMTTALGDPGRLVGVVVLLAATPVAMLILIPEHEGRKGEMIQYATAAISAYLSIILSFLIPYDFRGDVDLIEELKTLPIRPTRLALGQLLAPTVVASVAQGFAMLIAAAASGRPTPAAWAFFAFLPPVNLLFFAIENLLFLWYPSRVVAGQFDVLAIGRQMLFMMAKILGLGVAVGLAAGLGALVYFFLGRSPVAATVAAWLVVSATALAVLPLVGRAFERFDVSSDVPA